MGDYNTEYKLNPRIREIIEQRRGFKEGISHAQAEVIMRGVFLGEYKGTTTFTTDDKGKIMSYLATFNPNEYDRESLKSFAEFFNKVFDKQVINDFVRDKVNHYYHPGGVIHNIKISNVLILYFISLFSDFPMYKGILINTTFIGDVKKIYPEVKFNENSGAIEDETANDKVLEFVSNLKKKHKKKVKIAMKDGIFAIASGNELVINDLSTYGLNIDIIPDFYFEWK